MRRLPGACFASVALLAGCLQEGRSVVGRSLVPGRNVEAPAFVKEGAWVTFELRRKSAVPPFSGAYDFAMVDYDSGEVRTLVENAADRWGRIGNETGLMYLLADETLVPNPTVPTTMGTLVTLDLDRGVIDRVPEVTSFSVLGRSRELYYRRATTGTMAELHYRSAGGVDRPLGLAAGQVEFRGKRLIYVAGEQKVLSSFVRPDGPVVELRKNVTRFRLNGDDSWAILQTSDTPHQQAVAHSLETGVERVIPGSGNCYWLDLDGTTFVYVEPAAGEQRARIHTYDLATEEHRVSSAPARLVDVRDIRSRPGTTDRLFLDSRGQLAVVHEGDVDGNVIGGTPGQLSWTDDGKYALWIDLVLASPPKGRLMVQDLDFREPPRVLSPPGGMVPVPGYRMIPDGLRRIVAFWAHFGNNVADLYYADHRTGDERVVAEGIGGMVIGAHQLVGVVRISGQDMVGDLVNKDLALDQEIVLAHDVADATIYEDRAVFVIRGRSDSERDGLWGIGIDGTPPGAADTRE
jgi:hypothetical protein